MLGISCASIFRVLDTILTLVYSRTSQVCRPSENNQTNKVKRAVHLETNKFRSVLESTRQSITEPVGLVKPAVPRFQGHWLIKQQNRSFSIINLPKRPTESETVSISEIWTFIFVWTVHKVLAKNCYFYQPSSLFCTGAERLLLRSSKPPPPRPSVAGPSSPILTSQSGGVWPALRTWSANLVHMV